MKLKNIFFFISLAIASGIFCYVCCKIACNCDSKRLAFFIGYIGASLIEPILINVMNVIQKDI